MKKRFNKDFFILVSLTLIFFLVQMVVPYIGIDDISAQSNIIVPGNIFTRGIERGINWNMRIGEIIFFTVGLLPKVVYNIMISLFFAWFLILMKKYSNTNYKNKASQYILYFFLIMFFMPSTLEDMFKMSDACNHLVGTCFTLTVLLPLIRYDNGIDVIDGNKLRYNLLIILAFFAGMSSENNSIFILIFLVYIILKNLIKSKKIIRWHLFTFISTLAGYSLLIFCRSTMRRIEFFNGIITVLQSSSIGSIFSLFYYYNKSYIIFFSLLLVIYLIIGFIKFGKNFKIDSKIKYNLFLLILSTTTLLMFLFAPYFSNKGVLFIQFILIINIVDLINIICSNINSKILFIVSLILLILSLITTYRLGEYFYKYRIFDRNRNKNIIEQVNKNENKIDFALFKEPYNKTPYFLFQDLTICTEDIVKVRYNIDYEFELVCEKNSS